MALPDVKEKWSSKLHTVTLGATPQEGGTRGRSIRIGGEGTLPFLHFEGATPNPPVLAMEIMDIYPQIWADFLEKPFGAALKSPVDWAKKCVEEFGADMICIKLTGIHPDFGNASPQQAGQVVKAVKGAVDVPLIVWGCDDDAKDNEALPVCSQVLAGERALLGTATKDNYKTLVVSCLADGHALITESPIDINIAKQVNILVSDMDLPLDRVVMYPTTGALGYGIEYVYSIQERGRIAALTGDRIMATPVICRVGAESWRAKEAKAAEEETPGWGPMQDRGALWETITAATLLQAGADVLIMLHPKAVEAVRGFVGELMTP